MSDVRQHAIDEIIEGLSRPEKMISPKYFYDERGSQLFEKITTLAEYYPTETELGIMRDNIDEMADLIGPQASLIEFGSGSSLKTRILLANLHEQAVYVPVDISEDLLLHRPASCAMTSPTSTSCLSSRTSRARSPYRTRRSCRAKTLSIFPAQRSATLFTIRRWNCCKVMYEEAGEDGALLIGVDLQKDPAIIEAAYNDSDGVTAEFNLNMLRHLNREFGTNFEVDSFIHDAIYNEEEGRIEIRLINSRRQDIRIGDRMITIDKDEAILTEYSHKYTRKSFAAMAHQAGFEVEHVWTDEDELFSVQYCVRA